MLRAKQKTVSILVAILTLLAALILGISSLFSLPQTTASAAVDGNGSFVKVTEEPDDWSGDYLIVYETGKVAFNGALTTLDANQNRISVAISNNEIAYTSDLAKAIVTIAPSGTSYTIQSASGYYIGATSNSNSLLSNKSTKYTNTLTYNNGDINIKGSGGAYLRYNASSGTERFRYYKSSTYTGQKAIQLYKWTPASSEPECVHENWKWVYDSATKEHYQQCDDCETEIENTRAACSEFTYGDYTTVDGVHTQTATCIVCGGEQEQSGDCEVSAEYVREGNQHTQTGTCAICGETTTVTED